MPARQLIILQFLIVSPLLWGCMEEPYPVIIATTEISDITNVSAVSGGKVIFGQDAGIIETGIVWSVHRDPTIGNNSGKLSVKGGTDEFSGIMEGLDASTAYYVRAYSTNSAGSVYGDERSFRTYKGTVYDIDGNTYYTISAGAQEWMGSNLNTGSYRNGDIIEYVEDNNIWRLLDTGARSAYNHNPELQAVYGSLYNWYAVTDNRGLCPDGWRVPSDNDWKVLEQYLGMTSSSANRVGLRDRYAGGRLKETGSNHWFSPNILATDETGFSAIPGGYRHPQGEFYTLGRNLNWWTTTSYNDFSAWYRNIYYNNAGIYRNIYTKTSGFSVRCIRE